MSRQDHWEGVYQTRAPDSVSWYQAEPTLSLDMIEACGLPSGGGILDVGGGASVLVDRLLAAGRTEIGVLDLSAAALNAARERLGPAGDAVDWIVGDLLDYETPRSWDLWHDRAVFHFLTDPEDRRRYREVLHRTVPMGGHVIVATFGPDGPQKCSGLDTLRCSAEDIARELGDGVHLVDSRTEIHQTPSGSQQQFVYARLLRVAPE